MPRDSRYDILFEPVQIGPVKTKNRFYQVPHCNGMGYRDPTALARMRGIKAEGGWGVVCTEHVELHHTSDITPFIELRLWDDRDIPALARMADAIHEYDALAGIEPVYSGINGPNLYTREVPLAPMNLPIATFSNDPLQARAMTKKDFADLRRWHRNAAIRAKRAGYDLIYVYAAHGLSILQYFLSKRYNQRTDEYGGSVENRARLLREIIEDTRDAVGDTCAVACRVAVDELMGPKGLQKKEAEDMIGSMAELPDLWDFTIGNWENNSATSRFADEGFEEPFVKGMKALTTKPVVGIGRFTSPDTMVSQIRRGVLDLIGAARPSIADPFLPKKIEEGRGDEIRECIGCNICVSGDFTMSPIRCTQNPTMGEEWRRGWHPEYIRPKTSEATVLVVGSGPAGLECTRALAQRGYEVTLAEKRTEMGGRVAREHCLPHLSAWGRVADYRTHLITQKDNVNIYYDSELSADDVLGLEFEHVAIATGAYWRADGVARYHTLPIPVADDSDVLTPDDLMDGRRPRGRRVVVYDDDHYYMANVLAELLVNEGFEVIYVTPENEVATWTRATMEQPFIQKRLLELGVDIRVHTAVTGVSANGVELVCTSTGREDRLSCDSVLAVTARLPNDALYQALIEREEDWAEAGVKSVTAIGDCLAPATIAAAVYSGRKYAENFDEPPENGDVIPFKREITELVDIG